MEGGEAGLIGDGVGGVGGSCGMRLDVAVKGEVSVASYAHEWCGWMEARHRQDSAALYTLYRTSSKPLRGNYTLLSCRLDEEWLPLVSVPWAHGQQKRSFRDASRRMVRAFVQIWSDLIELHGHRQLQHNTQSLFEVSLGCASCLLVVWRWKICVWLTS